MNRPVKRYIVWTNNGNSQYVPTEYDTVEEAVLAPKYGDDWFLTEAVNDIYASTRFNVPKKEEEITKE